MRIYPLSQARVNLVIDELPHSLGIKIQPLGNPANPPIGAVRISLDLEGNAVVLCCWDKDTEGIPLGTVRWELQEKSK